MSGLVLKSSMTASTRMNKTAGGMKYLSRETKKEGIRSPFAYSSSRFRVSIPRNQEKNTHSENAMNIREIPAEYLSNNWKNQKPALVEKIVPAAK